MKAFQTGVRHALAAGVLKRGAEILLSSPNKKQTLMARNNGYKKSTLKRSIGKSSGKVSTAVVKKAILGMSSSYFDTQVDSTLNISGVVQSTIYTNNLTAQITQGTSVYNRQGDSIFIKNVHIKGAVFSDSVAGAYQFRVMLVTSGEEYDFGTGFGSGLTSGQMFLTPSVVPTNSIVNPKAITVLHDETIDINSQVSGAPDIAGVDFLVRMNKKFPYQSDGAVYGKTKNLYLVVIGFRLGAGVGVDVGDVFLNTAVEFKNL